MILTINLFKNLVESKAIANVTVNSFVPPIKGTNYGISILSSVFLSSFQNLQPGDEAFVSFYEYGSTYQESLKGIITNGGLYSFEEYKDVVNQWITAINQLGVNVSFRSMTELYNDYVSTVEFLPASGIVSILSSNYEIIPINVQDTFVSIPALFSTKLPISIYAKAIYLFVPQLSLTVPTVKELYDIYLKTFEGQNVDFCSNALFENAKSAEEVYYTIDYCVNTFIGRDMTLQEVQNLVTNNGANTAPYVEYVKYMLNNYGLLENAAYQMLLFQKSLRRETLNKILRRGFRVPESIDANRPLLLTSSVSNAPRVTNLDKSVAILNAY